MSTFIYLLLYIKHNKIEIIVTYIVVVLRIRCHPPKLTSYTVQRLTYKNTNLTTTYKSKVYRTGKF